MDTLARCQPAGVRWILVFGAIVPLALTACEKQKTPPAAPEAAGKGVVYTTFYPTTYWAQRVAGDAVKIVNPCPAEADPAYWMPSDDTISAYQQADLIVVNGASFEKWLQKVSFPEARIVDTTMPLQHEFITLKDAVTHRHGPTGEHTHEGIDGHTWLDPVNAKTQADEIKTALIKSFPAHAETFEQGFAALAGDLDALDARLRQVSGKLGDQLLLANHPAWNYLARRYGWQLKTFHLDPEEMPAEETIKEIKTFLAQQPAKYILWEAEPLDQIKQLFAEQMGLTSVVYSPGEALDPSEQEAGTTFLTIMNANIDRLERALAGAERVESRTPTTE